MHEERTREASNAKMIRKGKVDDIDLLLRFAFIEFSRTTRDRVGLVRCYDISNRNVVARSKMLVVDKGERLVGRMMMEEYGMVAS